VGVIAVYPGSFDPVTNGHLDLARRAGALFDEIVIAVLRNPEKGGTFPIARRLELLEEAARGMDRVRVTACDGLLGDFVEQLGAQAIVRGLRAMSDFEYEFQMALMNRRLSSRIETVYLTPAEQYTYLSSSLVREVSSLGGSVEGLVPPGVARALKDLYGHKEKE
jgi:pantetheine-phosphate adenylyltransferase